MVGQEQVRSRFRDRLNTTPRRILALGVVSALLFASGCVKAQPSPNDTSASEHDRVIDALKQLANPSPTLGFARSKLTARCMGKHGFRYYYPNYGVNTSSQTSNLPGIVEVDPLDAQGRGYGLAIGFPRGPNPDELQDRYSASLSPADRKRYDIALWGTGGAAVHLRIPQGTVSVATSGCFARAARALYGSIKDFLMADSLWQGLYTFQRAAWSDPQARAAAAAYAACMTENGYRVQTPRDAVALAQKRFGSRAIDAPPSTAEIRQAEADARCQATSSIVSKYETALIESASYWIESNRTALLKVALGQRQALDRAAAVIG